MDTLKRRLFILIFLTFCLFVAVVVRFFYIQVIESRDIQGKAMSLKTRVKLYPPERGDIYSSDGKLLVTNEKSIDIITYPSEIRGEIPEELYEVISEEELMNAKRIKGYYPYVLKTDINYQEAAILLPIMVNAPYLYMDIVNKRYYPFGEELAHVIGYVKIERYYMYRGMYGVEGVYDEFLRGEAEKQVVEVNAFGKEIKVIERTKGKRGSPIILTINMELQSFAHSLMADKEGTIIVMQPFTGEILTLVSQPSFDPNRLSRRIDTKIWNNYLEHPGKPLINRAISAEYHPGSVFKVIVAIAALEEGIIDPKDKKICRGKFEFGKRKYRCWRKEGHGWVDLKDAIAKSCDVYFYNIGLVLGASKIAKWAKKFGIGEKTQIDLVGEKSGILPSPEWKKKFLNEKWHKGEDIPLAIGQGYLTTTPIQIARAISAIVNGGFLVTPHVVKSVGKDELNFEKEKIDVSPETLYIVKEAMVDVVRRGTAVAHQIPGLEYGGKTGTAQVVPIETIERVVGKPIEKITIDEIPKDLRDHAWFAAFAPAENPEIVVAVAVEHCGGGAKCAAPIAREIIKKYMEIKNRKMEEQKMEEIEISREEAKPTSNAF